MPAHNPVPGAAVTTAQPVKTGSVTCNLLRRPHHSGFLHEESFVSSWYLAYKVVWQEMNDADLATPD